MPTRTMQFALELSVDSGGRAQARLRRRDTQLDYGELSLVELRYVLEALVSGEVVPALTLLPPLAQPVGGEDAG